MASTGINKVILVGNLGRDPEVKTTEQGIRIAKFSLATTEVYRDKDGSRKEQTEWHNVVAWRNHADYCERNLKKGSTVYLEGKLHTRNWEDQNKVKQYRTEVVVDNLLVLGNRKEYQGSELHSPGEEEQGSHADPSDMDGLPF
jgi:single-strand DNA-binding protein